MYFRVIADAENVIYGHVVKGGKLNQNVGWGVSLPKLLIANYSKPHNAVLTLTANCGIICLLLQRFILEYIRKVKNTCENRR